ncbi:MAG: hypothetical protein WDN66_03835 [Candidatus Saccharibacteria bacterium]
MAKDPISLKDRLLSSPPKNSKYYIIAIDGRGGAGKTSLSMYLQKLLPDFCFICGDDYFEPVSHPIAWGGYNEERFEQDVIKPLWDAKAELDYRPYDWVKNPHISDHKVTIGSGVFIDRCYSFAFDLNFDLKIWVETPRDVTLKRGISRSSMPKEKAELVWRELWKPMEDKYIEDIMPLKTADIIISGDEPFENQVS